MDARRILKGHVADEPRLFLIIREKRAAGNAADQMTAPVGLEVAQRSHGDYYTIFPPPGRVERNAPRRVRPPPRQTVRAVFPHTAFHVELTLSLCAPFPHLIQSHRLPLVVIRLRVFQLVPPLACML